MTGNIEKLIERLKKEDNEKKCFEYAGLVHSYSVIKSFADIGYFPDDRLSIWSEITYIRGFFSGLCSVSYISSLELDIFLNEVNFLEEKYLDRRRRECVV